MQTEEEIQSVLELFWADQRVIQRVAQQIHQAQLSIYQITQHYFYLERTIYLTSTPTTLLIALGKAFPLSSPFTLLKAGNLNSLKDYQDLTALALGQQWHHSKHSLTQLLQQAEGILSQITVGKTLPLMHPKTDFYHIRRYYDYTILKDLAILPPFICFEQLPESVCLFVIALTNSHFLLFHPNNQPSVCNQVLKVPKEGEINGMRLAFVAQLQSLRQIEFDRSSKNEYTLTFATMRIKQGQCIKTTYQKTLHVTRSYQFIDELTKRMKTLGMLIDLSLGTQINEEERELMLKTRLCENRLDKYLNRKTIIELNDAYQRMIEHYQTTDLPYQEIFISKINTLSQKDQVKFILEAETTP